ncbi:MAG: DUF4365 domain-containing protein [Leptolyngbyaceae cyanobacterium bins.349]|nr:DUF4365 domain-containing protein [Leptolyngbyaceae cyanobacterium bins.349]
MKQDLAYFIGQRAEALANVYLTRSQNLVVQRLDHDFGIDLLVEIAHNNRTTGKVFGVQIKGRDKALKNGQKYLLPITEEYNQYFQNLPFPVCLLLFTMEDDKGYYQWVNYSTSSSPDSNLADQAKWRSLDGNGIEHLLQEVNDWYDAKRHSVT